MSESAGLKNRVEVAWTSKTRQLRSLRTKRTADEPLFDILATGRRHRKLTEILPGRTMDRKMQPFSNGDRAGCIYGLHPACCWMWVDGTGFVAHRGIILDKRSADPRPHFLLTIRAPFGISKKGTREGYYLEDKHVRELVKNGSILSPSCGRTARRRARASHGGPARYRRE